MMLHSMFTLCVLLAPIMAAAQVTPPTLTGSGLPTVLTWSHAATTQTGFIMERRVDPSPTWTALPVIAPTLRTYTDPESFSTRTCYHVKAVYGATSSAYSNDFCTTAAPAPTATLTWVDNSDREDGFVIERSPQTPTRVYAEIARTTANVTTYVDPLQPGDNRCYRVKAFAATETSIPSNEACLQIPLAPLPAPGTLTVK
jgi:hypothetical protein